VADRLRVGIAGGGKIVASEHVPRLRAIEGVELVAVANQTQQSSERAAAAMSIPRAARHWGELIEDPDIDAILIGTWPYLHAPIAIAALEYGKHVLTEARMATDGDAASAMLDASLDHPELVAMVVPASFSLWADRAIGRVLGDGSIGRLQAARLVWASGRPTDADEHWRWQRRYSGNNIMALGIALESVARWLGHAEWVTGELQIVEPRKPGPTGAPVPSDVPDHVLAIAGFPGEVTLSLEMSTITLAGQGIHAVFYGTDGSLDADFGAEALRLTRNGDGLTETVTIAEGERDEWRAERDFVAAIRGEKAVDLTDFDTGRRYMQFVDAIHESNRSGQRVVIEG
jgi:predicted dehydrogenase